jgi:hypothetical protein
MISAPLGGAGGLSGAPVLLAPGSAGPSAPKAMPSPTPTAPSPGGNYSGQSTWQPPNYISDASTQSAINNRMGQAQMMGDPRVFQKQMARNGVSASRGTDYFAQVGQQQALSAGRADAAGIAAQDQMNNAKSRLAYQYGSESEAQSLAMVQHALSQADWSRGFAGQQAAATVNAAKQKAYLDALRRLLG